MSAESFSYGSGIYDPSTDTRKHLNDWQNKSQAVNSGGPEAMITALETAIESLSRLINLMEDTNG